MNPRYLGLAIATGLTLIACNGQSKNDFKVIDQNPNILYATASGIIGPTIFEVVAPWQNTHNGPVEYQVEFLDSQRKPIQSYFGSYERTKQATAWWKRLTTPLVTIMVTPPTFPKSSDIHNPFPQFPTPRDAWFVRVTVDPKDTIPEGNEGNNSLEFRIHA